MRKNRRTLGHLSDMSPPLCDLELRQGADSIFPRPYVHKVGSAGKMWRGTISGGPLFAALGINLQRNPQTTGRNPYGRRDDREHPGRLFDAIGTHHKPRQRRTISGPAIGHNNPIVAGVEPESWEPGEGLLDNIGQVLEYEPLEADCVAVVFRPASGRVAAKKRTLPVELCCLCRTRAEFIAWCARFAAPEEAGQAWDEITRRPRNTTVGRRPARPF